MKLFNIVFAIASLIYVSFSEVSCQTAESKLVLKAVFKGTYNLTKGDSTIYFLVEVKLINNTDSICDFMAYNCAAGASILFNSDQVKICPNQCSMNYPTHIIINPNQEFIIPIVLQSKRDNSSLNGSLKIGYVLVPPSLFKATNFNELLFNMKKNNENVLWSDAIFLSNTGGDPYDIR